MKKLLPFILCVVLLLAGCQSSSSFTISQQFDMSGSADSSATPDNQTDIEKAAIVAQPDITKKNSVIQ